ncbi:hypothetical protein CSF_1000 [Campylobacter sputorum bv. faecalis CCUG 20703]|nr:hypothetical protein CSF_1000 [Campylobacter sputorum bv. faecalis CCUG 20703]
MSEFSNAFWREFQYRIFDKLIELSQAYIALSWVIFYIVGGICLFIGIKLARLYKIQKSTKTLKLSLIGVLLICAYFYYLLKFSIYKSNNLGLWFCIFSWFFTIFILFFCFKTKKIYLHSNKNKKQSKQNNKKSSTRSDCDNT